MIATRDRAGELDGTLARLRGLEERPPVLVVDNGSSDATLAVAREGGASVLALGANFGGAARTMGARTRSEPYVAFSDDDSWWAPGALTMAADLLDAHPRLALVAARVLVGPAEVEDAVCAAMAVSPLPREPDLPGRSVLGFVACGAVLRREAFLGAGGFHARYGIGGEEELLALDLAAAGLGLAYVPEVVAHHHPSAARDPGARRRRQLRNALWSTWLRSPWRSTPARSVRILRVDPRSGRGLLDALAGVPWVLRERRGMPPHVDRSVRLLEAV